MIPNDKRSADAPPASAKQIGSVIPKVIISKNMLPITLVVQLVRLNLKHSYSTKNNAPAP